MLLFSLVGLSNGSRGNFQREKFLPEHQSVVGEEHQGEIYVLEKKKEKKKEKRISNNRTQTPYR